MPAPEDLSDWMSLIPDDRSITQLTLPGTHNSHATSANYDGSSDLLHKDYTTCQAHNIPQQLRLGVRYIDLRVGNNDYKMRHGQEQLKNQLKDVLGWINDFLKEHKKETVLVSIKWDDGGEPSSIDKYIYDIWQSYHWYSGNDWPKLGQTRGQAVLLRRFSCHETKYGGTGFNTLGVDVGGFWGQSFRAPGPGAWSQNGDGKAEDERPETVWDTVWKQINRASASHIDDGWQHFTFLNHWGRLTKFNLATPHYYAGDLNPHLMSYLNNDDHHEDPKWHRYGCIVTDYFYGDYGAEMVGKNWDSRVYKPNNKVAAASDNPFIEMRSPRGDKVQFFLTKRAVLKIVVNDQELWNSGREHPETTDYHGMWFEADGNLVIWGKDDRDHDHGGRSQWWNTETRMGWDTRVRFLAGPPYILVDFCTGKGDVKWWPNKK